MNCTMTREEIDRQVFETGRMLSPEALSHIETCPGCRNHFKQSHEAGQIMRMIRSHDPKPEKPHEITENILGAIGKPAESPSLVGLRNSSIPVTAVLSRILAAASVCLFIIFGVEQYRIVDKVTLLERQNSAIANDPGYRRSLQLSTIKKLIEYNADYMMKINGQEGAKSAKASIQTGNVNIFRAAILLTRIKEQARHKVDGMKDSMEPLPDKKIKEP